MLLVALPAADCIAIELLRFEGESKADGRRYEGGCRHVPHGMGVADELHWWYALVYNNWRLPSRKLHMCSDFKVSLA